MKTFTEWYEDGGIKAWVESVPEPFSHDKIHTLVRTMYTFIQNDAKDSLAEIRAKVQEVMREAERGF